MVSTLLATWIAISLPPDLLPVRIPRGEVPRDVSDDPRPAGVNAKAAEPPKAEDQQWPYDCSP